MGCNRSIAEPGGKFLLRFLIAALYVGHGLVHGIMFGLTYSPQAVADLPFNPSRSWLFGETRTLGFVSALVVTVAFIVAGAGYGWRAEWWPQLTIIAVVLSTALLLAYFSKWWTVGFLINIGLVALALRNM